MCVCVCVCVFVCVCVLCWLMKDPSRDNHEPLFYNIQSTH